MKHIHTFESFLNEADRSGLMGNFAEHQAPNQSMARFQIGDEVICCNPNMKSSGMIGKIIAFEDAYIRWEVSQSTTGIGQTSVQYRCKAEDLCKPTDIVAVQIKTKEKE